MLCGQRANWYRIGWWQHLRMSLEPGNWREIARATGTYLGGIRPLERGFYLLEEPGIVVSAAEPLSLSAHLERLCVRQSA